MSKMVQRVVALVVMLVVVMGGTIWGTASMTIQYQPLNSGAPVVMTVNGDEVGADEYAGYMLNTADKLIKENYFYLLKCNMNIESAEICEKFLLTGDSYGKAEKNT